jgi:pimeloyl-ACP methyl ester carboxylesterase
MANRHLLGLGPGGFHRVAYTEWGAAGAGVPVVCVHGLTRTGRDFDRLAAHLAAGGRRVVCPDVVGRGASDWLADPAGYAYPQYLADMTALIARLDAPAVDWVGTSMGGLIGMMLASRPRCPIRRLVLNDIGPFLPRAALERIAGTLGDASFPDVAAFELHLRSVIEGFGPMPDDAWRALAEHSHRRRPDGTVAAAYDPAIAAAFTQRKIADIDLWGLYEQIDAPVLVLRGGRSDLLLPGTATEMGRRGPRARVLEFPEVGHAPALMTDDQIVPVAQWLGQ